MILFLDFDPPAGTFDAASVVVAANLDEAIERLGRGDVEVAVLGPPASADVAGVVQRLDEAAAPVGLLFVVAGEKVEVAHTELVRAVAYDDARVPAVLRACVGEVCAYAKSARKDREVARMQKLQLDLLSMVAHDIRAPLGVVVGALNELSHKEVGELNEEQKFLLVLVRRSVERLTRLASNLSFLGRMEAGRVELRRRSTDLRAVVRQVVDDAQRIDAGSHIAVAFEEPAEPMTANVDGERIAQVASNLLSNAVRFAKKNVSVTLRSEGDAVVLEVSDDGPGIPPEYLSRIFERFSRIEAPKSGTGLGLAIVRGIVDAHGGSVTGANREAGGAVLTVRVTKAG